MTHFIHSSASGFSHSIPQQFAILTAEANIAFLFCHLVQHTQNIVSQTVQIRLDEICLNHEAQAKITKLLRANAEPNAQAARLLRVNQYAIGSNGYRCVKGERIWTALIGIDVTTEIALK